MFFSTGSFCQYLSPSHSLRLAGFSGTWTEWTSSLPSTFSVGFSVFCCGSSSPMAYACHGSSFSLFAIFSSCSGSGCAWRRKGLGGVIPPSVTEERKPSRCRPSARLTCILETGIDVRPRRAFDAFCRCEQTCARLTRDMLAVLSAGWPSRGYGDAVDAGDVSGPVVWLAQGEMQQWAIPAGVRGVNCADGRRPCWSG